MMRSFLLFSEIVYCLYAQIASVYISEKEYYEFANPFPESADTSGQATSIKMAYPVNVCTKDGSQFYFARHRIYQCSLTGNVLYGGCEKTDATCTVPFDSSG